MPHASPDRSQREPPVTVRRLLVVDDEAGFCSFAAKVGRELGYEVETLTDPFGFMDLYERFRPDIVLLDIFMPGLDGIELIQRLAAIRAAARILIATSFDPVFARAAERLGRLRGLSEIRVMLKPVRAAELREALA